MGVRACGRQAGLRGRGLQGQGLQRTLPLPCATGVPRGRPASPCESCWERLGTRETKKPEERTAAQKAGGSCPGCSLRKGDPLSPGRRQGKKEWSRQAWGQGRQSPVLSVAEEARGRPEPQGGSNFQQPNSHQDPGSPERRAGRPRASHRASIPCCHFTVQRRSGASRKKLRTIQVSEENSAWSNL